MRVFVPARSCSQNREKLTTPRGTATTYAIKAKQSWEGRTTSPTGRAHPNRERRNDVRNADLHHSINFFATSRVSGQVAGTGDAVYEVRASPSHAPLWIAARARCAAPCTVCVSACCAG